MIIQNWLNAAVSKLTDADSATARLDALVLLEDALQTDRALLLAHPDRRLTAEQLSILRAQLARRVAHEPLAYVRGQAEFYGRMFAVTTQVLVPRPETEAMIDLLKQLPAAAHRLIVDVGTGSGALAITAKLELPAAVVMATDIDPACLELARRSAGDHHAEATFQQSDLLAGMPDDGSAAADLHIELENATLLCNLPYVPDDFPVNQAAQHEPRLALYGGQDGLDLYRRLFAQLGALAGKPGYVLTEALPQQQTTLATIARAHGYLPSRTAGSGEGFIQIFQSF